jgi:hypothetical protein
MNASIPLVALRGAVLDVDIQRATATRSNACIRRQARPSASSAHFEGTAGAFTCRSRSRSAPVPGGPFSWSRYQLERHNQAVRLLPRGLLWGRLRGASDGAATLVAFFASTCRAGFSFTTLRTTSSGATSLCGSRRSTIGWRARRFRLEGFSLVWRSPWKRGWVRNRFSIAPSGCSPGPFFRPSRCSRSSCGGLAGREEAQQLLRRQ